MDDRYQDCRIVAERAAREAGNHLLSMQGQVTAREKGPGDLVTEADLEAQRLIGQIIGSAFPDHTLLAEEGGVEPDRSNAWRWIVDPLDGTINYAHGLPIWCVSIALEHSGELVVGVIHDPIRAQTFSAVRGSGAELNGRRLAVSRSKSLRDCLIAAGMPTAFGADAERQLALMGRMSTGTHSVRRTGSSALNLAWVAAGLIDVFYSTSIHPWDVAAGVTLVREAGGIVTSLSGRPYDLYGGEILATNGLAHREAVDALQSAWSSLNRKGTTILAERTTISD